MVKIEYKKYTFNPPSLLEENQYNLLKELLNQNEELNIRPPSEFFKEFLPQIISSLLGIIGLSIIVQNYTGLISWIGIILSFGSFVIFSLVPSLFYYLHYSKDRRTYYKRLKSDTIESKNYDDFLKIRERRRFSLTIY